MTGMGKNRVSTKPLKIRGREMWSMLFTDSKRQADKSMLLRIEDSGRK